MSSTHSLPKISVISTCYNRESYLPQCIESVLSQSFSDLELIVWNDGSSDYSVKIARSYANQDSRIKVVDSAHQGSSKALKQAIGISKGEYIGCVDSDDFLLPGCLEKTYKVISANPGLGFVYTQYFEVDEMGNRLEMPERCKWPYVKEFMAIGFLTFHFRLIRRSIYDLVGGVNINYPVAHDYELAIRLSEVADVKQLREPLYCYRKHSDSISAHHHQLQQRYCDLAIDEHYNRRLASSGAASPDS